MIPIEAIDDLFEKMKEQGWDTGHVLMWGFFFVDSSAERLMELSRELTASGYHMVALTADDNRRSYTLYMEKLETHSRQSLDQRNLELTQLAEERDIDRYDGVDVGLVQEEFDESITE